jgi:hypothetical protein
MKELYTALCAALRSVEGLAYIDLYNRQYEDESRWAQLLPGVLVEMRTDWQGQGKGYQRGLCTVTLHVGDHWCEDTYDGAPGQADGLARYFDRLQAIYLAVQGLTGERFSGLERRRTEPDTEFGGLLLHRTVFETTIADPDKAAGDQSKLIKVSPALFLGKNIVPDTAYPQPPVFPQ